MSEDDDSNGNIIEGEFSRVEETPIPYSEGHLIQEREQWIYVSSDDGSEIHFPAFVKTIDDVYEYTETIDEVYKYGIMEGSKAARILDDSVNNSNGNIILSKLFETDKPPIPNSYNELIQGQDQCFHVKLDDETDAYFPTFIHSIDDVHKFCEAANILYEDGYTEGFHAAK